MSCSLLPCFCRVERSRWSSHKNGSMFNDETANCCHVGFFLFHLDVVQQSQLVRYNMAKPESVSLKTGVSAGNGAVDAYMTIGSALSIRSVSKPWC